MKVILDTNFLIIPYTMGIDIFSELERICGVCDLYIVDKTMDELTNIINTQKGKDRDAAKIALSLIENKGIISLKTEKNKIVDDLIVDIAENGEFIVATNDKELRNRLKCKTIILKSKKFLDFGG